MRYLIQHPLSNLRPNTFLEQAYAGEIRWTTDISRARIFATATEAMIYAGNYGVTSGQLVREEVHYTVV